MLLTDRRFVCLHPRGIADDRAKQSENSFFACNGTKLQSAPRKLQVNDSITVTVDVVSGFMEISVNHGEFSFQFGEKGPKGNSADFWFGATFGESIHDF